jgi:hypothetical protein
MQANRRVSAPRRDLPAASIACRARYARFYRCRRRRRRRPWLQTIGNPGNVSLEGRPRSEQKLAITRKQPPDRKSPIQFRFRLPPAGSPVQTAQEFAHQNEVCSPAARQSSTARRLAVRVEIATPVEARKPLDFSGGIALSVYAKCDPFFGEG